MGRRWEEAFYLLCLLVMPTQGQTGDAKLSVGVMITNALADEFHNVRFVEDLVNRFCLICLGFAPLSGDHSPHCALQGLWCGWKDGFGKVVLAGIKWPSCAEQQWFRGFNEDAHYSCSFRATNTITRSQPRTSTRP